MLFLRKLKRSVLKRAYRLLHGTDFFVCGYLGPRFLVDTLNSVGREIATGTYDRDQLTRMLAACRRLQPAVFLDIGANSGLYTCVLLTGGVVPRAVAFEPDRRNAAHLRANLMINALAPRVDVREEAAGRGPGRVRLVPGPDANTGSSRLVGDLTDSDLPDGDGYDVELVRVEDVVDLTDGCIAAKIDVEGHELETLAGMARLLGRNRGVIQIETWDAVAEVETVMAGHGWHRVAAFPPDLVFEKD